MEHIETIEFQTDAGDENIVLHVQRSRNRDAILIIESSKNPSMIILPAEPGRRLANAILRALT